MPSPRRVIVGSLVFTALFVVIGLLSASTASNTVASSRLAIRTVATGINELRPIACAGMNLTTRVTGTGKINGTRGADLILAGRGTTSITGGGGDDCIMAGLDADNIDGSGGADVCVGSRTAHYKDCSTVIFIN